jgi:hypothetical protein
LRISLALRTSQVRISQRHSDIGVGWMTEAMDLTLEKCVE